jgi:8-oxo-dGTP diphosphatase
VTDIVNAVLLRDGKVLLARRGAHRRSYANCWSFPGGHVEAGETLEEALVREMAEEIGLCPLAWSCVDVLDDPADERINYHIFVVRDWLGGEPKLLGAEHTELSWFDLASAEWLDRLPLEDYRLLFHELKSAR